jgi:hypothetical protein
MSIFGKKQHLTRSELREALRKASPSIPGSGSMFSREKRVKLEKEFEQKYGSLISKEDFKRKIQELRRQKFRAKTSAEKTEFGRKLRYLKKIGGINI